MAPFFTDMLENWASRTLTDASKLDGIEGIYVGLGVSRAEKRLVCALVAIQKVGSRFEFCEEDCVHAESYVSTGQLFITNGNVILPGFVNGFQNFIIRTLTPSRIGRTDAWYLVGTEYDTGRPSRASSITKCAYVKIDTLTEASINPYDSLKNFNKFEEY